MKILVAHNRYQHPGGEDAVFEAEVRLLRDSGHAVFTLEDDNRRVDEFNSWSLAARTIWSRQSFQRMDEILRVERPDIIHLHNTFPLLSPSVVGAARRRRIPVVQTLHNYRLICPVATLFRSGRICEDCVGKIVPWPGVLHRCYRGSRSASAVVAAMLVSQRLTGSWAGADLHIALTEFARQEFVKGGMPPDRVVVKPNSFGPDPGVGDGSGGYFVYVGRLTVEKGIDTLLSAWAMLENGPELRIAGEGPLGELVEEAARRNPTIHALGQVPHGRALELMKHARALIVPSQWYEGSPVVLAEAFSVGLPVLASEVGSLADLVTEGVNGLRFRPGDASDLARRVRDVLTNANLDRRLREGARREYVTKYTPERNLEAIMRIYGTVLQARRLRATPD